jgi:hypothetical protein
MTQGTGGTDDVFKVHRYAVYPQADLDIFPPETTKQLLDDFKRGTTPLSPLPPPPSSVDLSAALQTITTNTTVDLDAPPLPANQVKQAAVKGSLQKLASFANNHPWLTIGFTLAILLLAGAAYLTVQNFLGHETLTIFQAHPVLGLSVIGMLVFYTAYLINMCKRAAMKDALEAKIEAQNKFTQELAKTKELDMEQLVKKKNAHILTLGRQFVETEKIHQEQYKALAKRRDDVKQTVENIEKCQTWLIGALVKLGQTMSTRDIEKTQSTLTQATLAIDRGGRLLNATFPEKTAAPLIPQLELLPSSVTFPPIPTEAMEKNKQKLLTLGEKLKNLLDGMGSTLKESPGTVLLLAGGVLMCLLAGVAIGFYLHGFTNLYFFGTLSLTAILPLAIYGLSMIYEGYNRATILKLEKDLENLEKNTQERTAALATQEQRIERINTEANTTLEKFSTDWASFQTQETTRLQTITQKLQDSEEKSLSAIENQCVTLLGDLYYGQVPPEEVKRLLDEKAKGATILFGT